MKISLSNILREIVLDEGYNISAIGQKYIRCCMSDDFDVLITIQNDYIDISKRSSNNDHGYCTSVMGDFAIFCVKSPDFVDSIRWFLRECYEY